MRFFKYFSASELFPSCTKEEVNYCIHRGYFDHILILVSVLDGFREEFEYPIILTSTFRDEEHNKYVGGVAFSQHLYGSAIDFIAKDCPFDTLVLKFKDFLNRSALSRFLGQVIIYKNKKFIHIGMRTSYHKDLTFDEKND